MKHATNRSLLTQLMSVTLIVAMVVSVSCDRKKTPPPAASTSAPASATDKGWPRVYTVDAGEVTLHQPQIDEWQNYMTLYARLAVTVLLKGSQEPVNGVVELRANTATNHETRLVTLYRPEIIAIRFPGAPPELAAQLEQAVRSLPPAKESTELALDRALAYVEQSMSQIDGAQVNLEPPPIFYSDRDAILISFLGEPRFSPIEGTSLEFGLNTNWDVIRDPKTSNAYLLCRGAWLVTNDVMKGTWAPATQLPADMSRLPKDEVWERVSKSVPGEKMASVPRVFVSTTPGEVIITEGRPMFAPIPGTNLAAISNSGNTVFYHQGDKQFYFLAAGRWFRAPDLTGPWTAATKTLPADFAAIPKDSSSAAVLASIPGTDEARDAVLMASIPTTAVVNRSEAKAEAVYDGTPEFAPIEKTTVQYAVNTANDVFLVGGLYYLCHQGVWFVGSTPNGPWSVADTVPSAIYSIPPTSPKYNVTYVHVYDSTPTTVTTGYTSGYNGEVVAAGIVMFGLGMAVAYNSHYHYGYYPPYYWGYGPRPMPYYGHYNYYAGPHGYGWSAHGPYGGAGYGARYNPATGIYSRGGYAYGPGGGAAYRAGYNPHTGAYGAQRGGYNQYGAWSQTAVRKGDDWARGGRYTTDNGTAAGFRTSDGAAGAAYRGDQGSGFVVRGENGNVYAGKDGNVYQRGDNGDWSSANRGGAQASSMTASRTTKQAPGASNMTARPSASGSTASTTKVSGGFGASPSSTNRTSAGTRQSSAGASSGAARQQYGAAGAGASASARTAPDAGVQDSLNRDYQARAAGNERAARSSGTSSYGGGSSSFGSTGTGRSGSTRGGGSRRH